MKHLWTQLAPNARQVIKVICGVLSVFVFAFVGLLTYFFWPLPRPPEIARGLPNGVDAAKSEFQARVTRTYGDLDVAALRQELSRQNFHFYDYPGKQRTVAIFEKRWRVCAVKWIVFWQDQQGEVFDLGANYGFVCP